MEYLPILFQEQQNRLGNIYLKKKRYLYELIDWSQRAILIIGQRGVGKTTILLQKLKEDYRDSSKALYISIDSPYFKTISLLDFAKDFEAYGGEILFVDEVHKYKDWTTHIKAIYDATSLKLVISGSSMIQIKKDEADLSRRVRRYHLANLSFREFLYFSDIADLQSYSIEEIFKDHIQIASTIKNKLKPLSFFGFYLRSGAYPFLLEDSPNYTHYIIKIVNQIMEVDLPYVANINFSQIDKLKKLLYLLSTSVPLKPNISKLANMVDISRPTLMEYIHYLDAGSLLNTVNYEARGYNIAAKPDKLYIHNTNLMYAISQNTNTGTMRETFFANQVKSSSYNTPSLLDENILLSDYGDFKVLNQYLVEIGGKNKSFDQIKDIENSFVVADDIEIGFGNKIPLWLFGFLY